MALPRSESRSNMLPSFTSRSDAFKLPGDEDAQQGLSLFGYQLGVDKVTAVLVVLVALLFLEQASYRWKKKHLPGKTWTIPLIGAFADSLSPSMEKYKLSWATPLSVASVFQYFIVMASDNTYVRKIVNSPSYAEPCLVASAKTVLEPDNWVFLSGKAHLNYRKGLNALFTRKAMSIYLHIQESIKTKYFAKWMADPTVKPMMMSFRDMNMENSVITFCGTHISPEGLQEINDKYWLITRALDLVNFPLAIPGTRIYDAVQARKAAMKHLQAAVRSSKTAMARGDEPACLLDRWCQNLIEDKEGVEKFNDREMALVVLSFIFASQDATSSSLTFGFQLIADHPEVFKRIREEQDRIRGGDYEHGATLDQIDSMTYTQAVVREILRFRPPVIMVPYLARQDFPLSDDYTAPKGSIVIPSFWNSLHDPSQYPDPDTFNPDRFMPNGNSINADPKNWLVFGSGPHICIGKEYVYLYMTNLLGAAAGMMDWHHERTPESDDIKIICTIFPKDDCHMKFTPRQR